MFDEYTRGEYRNTKKIGSNAVSDPTGFYIYVAIILLLFVITFIGIIVHKYKADHEETKTVETVDYYES